MLPLIAAADGTDFDKKIQELTEQRNRITISILEKISISNNSAETQCVAGLVSDVLMEYAKRNETADEETIVNRVVVLSKLFYEPQPQEVFMERAPVSNTALAQTQCCLMSLDPLFSKLKENQRSPQINILTGNVPASQFILQCCEDLIHRGTKHAELLTPEGSTQEEVDVTYVNILSTYADSYKNSLSASMIALRTAFNQMSKEERKSYLNDVLRTGNPLDKKLKSSLDRLDDRWKAYHDSIKQHMNEQDKGDEHQM